MAVTVQSGDDAEPIILMDEGAGQHAELLGLDAATLGFLRARGVTAPETISAFRLPAVDASLLARLGLSERRKPRGLGVCIPTWLPDDPASIVGILRVVPGQLKHRFLTSPIGLAGPISVATAARVVLVDHPFTAMRLHQSGVHNIALVEDPAVLGGLGDWLAGRDLVLASHRAHDLAAPRAALGRRGASLPGVLIAMAKNHYSSEVKSLLGITEVVARVAPPITSALLTQIHDYARGRVEAGEAGAALTACGLHDADLVQAYRIGFLPPDYRQALPMGAQRALTGRHCGNALVIPAFDDHGMIVDLLVQRVHKAASHMASFWPVPRGLFAPELIRGQPEVIVTHTLSRLGQLFQQGYRNVLLTRGVEDAQQHADLLREMGVKRIGLHVRHDLDALKAAYQAAGVIVAVFGAKPQAAAPILRAETPLRVSEQANSDRLSPPAAAPEAAPSKPVPVHVDTLEFVEEDRAADVALFKGGPIVYAVELREDGETKRRVTIRCGGHSSQDRFDLAIESQRLRCAGNAAQRCGQAAPVIAAHLAALLPAIREREIASDRGGLVEVSAEERAIGLALLDAPDLMDRVTADLTTLGWVGEDRTKRLLYLAAISRLLPEPVWTCYHASSGTAPWQGVGLIAALCPPDERVLLSRLTEASVAHGDPAHLRHHLLVIDAAETLRPEAAMALRVLSERGSVGWATAMPGVHRAIGETRGPCSVIAAAAGPLDERCANEFVTIPMDESPELTARILAAQRQRLADGSASVTSATAAVCARHHVAQRLLERVPVSIPFASRIVFPTSRLRHRQEQHWFLGLVAASAFLHQRRRQRVNVEIIASEADFDLVVECTTGVLGLEGRGISGPARQLIAALFEHRLVEFTMADVGGLFPDWTRYAFRSSLQELLDFGYVEAPSSGRGRQRAYRLVVRAGGAPQAQGIRLRPLGDAPVPVSAVIEAKVGELAKVGDSSRANATPDRTGT